MQIADKVQTLFMEMQQLHPEKQYRLDDTNEEKHYEHVLTWYEKDLPKWTVSWDETGFQGAEIAFRHLDEEADASMLRALRFHEKLPVTDTTHMFRNHQNFIEFWDILVVGSFKKLW